MKAPRTILHRCVSDFFRACQVACLILFVLVVGCYVAFYIGINTPKAKFTTEPLSLSEFYKRSGHLGGLPTAATNVFYVGSRVGFTGFVNLYRFDAPAADCISYGKRLLQENRASQPAELIPVKAPPEPISRRFLDGNGLAKAVDWFDVETVRSGFEGHLEWSDRPRATFWIDTERGRFYYFSSD